MEGDCRCIDRSVALAGDSERVVVLLGVLEHGTRVLGKVGGLRSVHEARRESSREKRKEKWAPHVCVIGDVLDRRRKGEENKATIISV
jgi:hypothetical protein